MLKIIVHFLFWIYMRLRWGSGGWYICWILMPPLCLPPSLCVCAWPKVVIDKTPFWVSSLLPCSKTSQAWKFDVKCWSHYLHELQVPAHPPGVLVVQPHLPGHPQFNKNIIEYHLYIILLSNRSPSAPSPSPGSCIGTPSATWWAELIISQCRLISLGKIPEEKSLVF